MENNKAYFRFYEELNDFLPAEKKKEEFSYEFSISPSVKDAIEAIGVPHVEVDLILVNGASVDFSYILKDGDRVSVYPVFESLDITNLTHLREKPLRAVKFILDVHLGKLAKYLRLFGFDTFYHNDYIDPEIIEIAIREKRIILSRDVEMLKNKKVTHGYWIRSQFLQEQLREVILRFDLRNLIKPFQRCLVCNGILIEVDKKDIIQNLKPKTLKFYNEFWSCTSCGKIYWKGSHYERMKKYIEVFTRLHSK